jgi:hypothetical protein
MTNDVSLSVSYGTNKTQQDLWDMLASLAGPSGPTIIQLEPVQSGQRIADWRPLLVGAAGEPLSKERIEKQKEAVARHPINEARLHGDRWLRGMRTRSWWVLHLVDCRWALWFEDGAPPPLLEQQPFSTNETKQLEGIKKSQSSVLLRQDLARFGQAKELFGTHGRLVVTQYNQHATLLVAHLSLPKQQPTN